MPGKLLDLAIGQFDTFTPLQLAQYVSTVANGGKRVQPRLAKEIREPSEDGKTLGPIIEEFSPNVLNTINNSQYEIDHVKEGMHRVYFGSKGTAAKYFQDAKFDAAGKTGTAEVVYYGPKKAAYGLRTLTITHIGFAPYKNPEIAYAVVVPWVTTNDNYEAINNEIAREAVDTYFSLKKKELKKDEETVGQKIIRSTSKNTSDNTEE